MNMLLLFFVLFFKYSYMKAPKDKMNIPKYSTQMPWND